MPKVLWEETDHYGLVVEPADRFERTTATMQLLRQASTWGEVRAADLAPWARELVANLEQDLEADLEAPVGDDEPWDYGEIAEVATDRMPLSHDLASTEQWLGRDLLAAHAETGGASPGGHIDGYRVRDRDAFLAAVQAAGYEPVHRPGFLQQLFKA